MVLCFLECRYIFALLIRCLCENDMQMWIGPAHFSVAHSCHCVGNWNAEALRVWQYFDNTVARQVLPQGKCRKQLSSSTIVPYYRAFWLDLLQASVCPNAIWCFVSWRLGNQISYLTRDQIQLWYYSCFLAHAPIAQKTRFLLKMQVILSPILYVLRLTSMRLYSSRGACSLKSRMPKSAAIR